MLCDRLAFLHNGRILICDTPRNLFGMAKSHVHLTVDGDSREYELADYRRELPDIFKNLYANETPRDVTIEIEYGRIEDLFLNLIVDAKKPHEKETS
jgi:ABC-type multidrug transport system ATPase subunit